MREANVKIDEYGDVVLVCVVNGHLTENAYFIYKKNNKKGIVIDPGLSITGLIDYIDKNDMGVEAILLTHCHFDHTYNVDLVRDKYKAKAYIYEGDAKGLLDSKINAAASFFKTLVVKDVESLKDGDELNIAGFSIRVIKTPGHTIGGACYLMDDKYLFSGDTLFKGTYGAVHFDGGSIEDMRHSIIDVLFKLNDDVLVFPGHDAYTTIAEEKESNPILIYGGSK